MHLDRPRNPGDAPARRRWLARALSASAAAALARSALGRVLAVGATGALPGPVRAAAPPPATTTPAPLPAYPTRLPDAVALTYDMSYGPIGGSGRLEWTPPAAGGRYRLQLVGRALGLRLLERASEGEAGPGGVLPGRFVERRIGRDERVAEFRREAGVVHYPGSKHADLAVPPGAQDPVSWLVQLPAILAADPSLQAPGQSIRLFVAGIGGKGEPWTFLVEDNDDGLVHLRRRTASGSEVIGETWLSPRHQWMPLRVRLAKADGGDALELKLAR